MRAIIFNTTKVPTQLISQIATKHVIVSSKEYSEKTIELELSKSLTSIEKSHLRHQVALFDCDLIFPKPHFEMKKTRLLAFDMDSTLITIECIDEIARAVGKMNEVGAITEAAMQGEIKDFATSLKQRVALLAGTPQIVLREVYEQRLKLSTGAENLMKRCNELGWQSILVSGGFTYFADRVKDQLGIGYAYSNVLEIDQGFLTGKLVGNIIDGKAKAQLVSNCALEHNISSAHVIVFGDGSNDLPMMEYAGLSIGFRAKPIVKERADGSFDHVGLDAILDLLN